MTNAERALFEAKREGLDDAGAAYRLVMIRMGQHEAAGRFKEAAECAAIRHELEQMAELRLAKQQDDERRFAHLPKYRVDLTLTPR